MSDHYADHKPEPRGVFYTWKAVAQGPGRWLVLHDMEGPAGVLFNGPEAGVGFLPFRATAIHAAVGQGMQAAQASGVSSPEIVFDYWADKQSQNVYAGPIQDADNLGEVADWVNDHNSPPVTG